MYKKLFPDILLDNYKEVTIKLLRYHKICAVMLDIDNTLVPYEVEEPTQDVVDWIQGLRDEGIKVCIVSNAKKERVEIFNKKLGVFFVYKASKPSTKGFIKAIEIMKVEPYQTAIIGDQIFTDIYGGNKTNMFTILVKPITNVEIIPIRIKRIFEKWVLYKYHKLYSERIKR